MKNYFLLFSLLAFLKHAHARDIRSCDRNYSARIAARSEILIEHAGRKMGVAKINHGIAGGIFDLTGELLVVYGIPDKVDLRSPQAEYLSIYLMKPRPHVIMRRTYGGVYDVAIGDDPNLILVSSRFGFDIVNIKTMKIKSFDPMLEPPFSRQQCENN